MKQLLLAIPLVLAACGQSTPPAPQVDYEQVPQAQPPVQYAQPAPVIVQPQSNGLVEGLILGHMLSGGGCCSGGSTIVTKNVTVNKTIIVRSAPAARPSYSSGRRGL